MVDLNIGGLKEQVNSSGWKVKFHIGLFIFVLFVGYITSGGSIASTTLILQSYLTGLIIFGFMFYILPVVFSAVMGGRKRGAGLARRIK